MTVPRSAAPPRRDAPTIATATHPESSSRLAARFAAALLLAAAALGLLASAARAQVTVDPQSIVVNPAPSFGVDVSLDRDPSGDRIARYAIGDSVTITVRTERAAYIYLYDVRPDGTVVQILPNRLSGGQSNRVPGGETVRFPPQGAPYEFQIDGPTGISRVIAVASERQLDTEQLASFRSGEAFATSDIGQEGFANAFSIVVRPVEQDEWVTDTVRYEVVARDGSTGGSPDDPAEQGTLRVDSTPTGATVLVDGRRLGTTPLDAVLEPGNRTVEIVRDGYRRFRTTVDLRAGDERNLRVTLEREPARSEPEPTRPLRPGERVWDFPTVRLPRGAELLELERNPRRAEVSFRIAVRTGDLYDLFDRQITEAGWDRRELRREDGELRAVYRLDRNTRLDLRLERDDDTWEMRLQLRGNARDDDERDDD